MAMFDYFQDFHVSGEQLTQLSGSGCHVAVPRRRPYRGPGTAAALTKPDQQTQEAISLPLR